MLNKQRDSCVCHPGEDQDAAGRAASCDQQQDDAGEGAAGGDHADLHRAGGVPGEGVGT